MDQRQHQPDFPGGPQRQVWVHSRDAGLCGRRGTPLPLYLHPLREGRQRQHPGQDYRTHGGGRQLSFHASAARRHRLDLGPGHQRAAGPRRKCKERFPRSGEGWRRRGHKQRHRGWLSDPDRGRGLGLLLQPGSGRGRQCLGLGRQQQGTVGRGRHYQPQPAREGGSARGHQDRGHRRRRQLLHGAGQQGLCLVLGSEQL